MLAMCAVRSYHMLGATYAQGNLKFRIIYPTVFVAQKVAL